MGGSLLADAVGMRAIPDWDRERSVGVLAYASQKKSGPES
jgi:hypothetical protein